MNKASQRTQPIRAVVVGMGGQGLRRAQALRMTQGWQLIGVYDADAQASLSAAKRLRCRCFTDETEAITCPSADVVVVATPPATHEILVGDAIGAFKHVLCEKPLAVRSETAVRLSDEAARRGLVLAVGFNHRFYGPVADGVALVRSGKLGRVVKIEARIGHPPESHLLDGWHGNVAMSGGGVLIDNGSHLIDLVRLFLGRIDKIAPLAAEWHKHKPGIDMRTKFRLTSLEGVTADLDCSWLDPDRPYLSMTIACEGGTLSLSAFPWRLEVRDQAGRTSVRRYWGDRLAMKGMGLSAPGLESSLMRELSSLRDIINAEAGSERTIRAGGALAADGRAVAEVIDALRDRPRPSTVPAPHFAARHLRKAV